MSEDKRWGGYHDPVQCASNIRWALARRMYGEPGSDLHDAATRYAETMERCVPSWWRMAAVVMALALLANEALHQAGW